MKRQTNPDKHPYGDRKPLIVKRSKAAKSPHSAKPKSARVKALRVAQAAAMLAAAGGFPMLAGTPFGQFFNLSPPLFVDTAASQPVAERSYSFLHRVKAAAQAALQDHIPSLTAEQAYRVVCAISDGEVPGASLDLNCDL